MADEIITSTQPDSVGNLLGDDIGVFDHYSSSPFQTEPLKPQPSAPQQPMSSGPNASKPLVDDFGLDPHITTTSASSSNKPVVNPMGGTPAPAAPNSSSSFTPGELTSNNPISDDDEEYDDDDDYRLNNHHQHHPKEGNNHHPNDDDDDGYDDREEELNYQKNGAPYQDNPAFSDYSDSEFHHHHSEARREPSPFSALPVDSGVVTNNEPHHAKSGGYDDSDKHDKSDDEDVEDIEEEDVVVRAPAAEQDQHPHPLDRHQDDDDHDKEEVDSLNEDNVVVLDDDEDGDRDDDEDDAQFVSASPAGATTTTTTSVTESPEITEPPFKSFDTEASPSLVSSEISSSPFSSSAAPSSSMTGGAVAEAVQEGPSAFDSAEGYPNPSQAMSTTTTTSYAPPSPSAPPAVATFSPPSPSDNATSAVISQITGDDDAASSGFGSAVTPVGKGQVSPSAAGTEILKNDHLNYDDDDDDDDEDDDDPEMPSDPPFSTSLSSSQTSAPQPSAPPQPVEADLFSPPITNSTNTPPQASSSTLYNSHSTREPESFFTAEPNVVQTSPLITDQQPKEVHQPKPTLEEGPWLKNIDPKVLDLIYWRDVKKTGVVFGSMLFILLSLAIFSVLSVVAYLSLAILSVTLSFRVYKNIMQAVQKSGDGHPFKEYLEWDLELNDQKTQKVVKLVMKHFNATVRELRRLFLVEDLVDSIKFGLLLWVLTYIGSWFNGMTLIINSVVIVFTLPKIYETYKVQIDNYLAMARSQFNKILQQVQSKLPFLKKKAKAQ